MQLTASSFNFVINMTLQVHRARVIDSFLGPDFTASQPTRSGKVSRVLTILNLHFHDDQRFQPPSFQRHLQ
jgi:hypothetical protein